MSILDDFNDGEEAALLGGVSDLEDADYGPDKRHCKKLKPAKKP